MDREKLRKAMMEGNSGMNLDSLTGKQKKMAKRMMGKKGMKMTLSEQMTDMMVENTVNLSPRSKLRLRNKQMRSDRMGKFGQQRMVQKTKENRRERIKKQAEETKEKQRAVRKQKRKQLKKWNTKYGVISDDKYLEIMDRLRANEYKQDDERNHDQNLLELYKFQQVRLGQMNENGEMTSKELILSESDEEEESKDDETGETTTNDEKNEVNSIDVI